MNHVQKRDWQLVLSARGIAFRISRFDGREQIYVQPLLAKLARDELAAFLKENRPEPKNLFLYPSHRGCALTGLFLLPLPFWHGLQHGLWRAQAILPDPSTWTELGRLDGIQIRIYGQWHRLFTSLTLHSGIVHLAGNLFFGTIFLALLARIAGSGRAFLLTIAGGATGNALSVLAHGANYQSIGFSTALFAAIGALASLMAMAARGWKKMSLPLAAALALLAMLGVEGENTDYAAHAAGLGAGICLGFMEALRSRAGWPFPSQALAGILAMLMLILAWAAAFGAV